MSTKVSVIMPVYNSALYVKDAMESILAQDYRDFQFIIVNDGSKDESENIILSFKDERIEYVKNEQNIGLIATLNKALKLVKGEYIVRIDGDDTCAPNRISTQVKFMDAHPEVGASGSFYYMMLGDKKAVCDFPTSNEEIQTFLLFNCPLAHPSSIIRKSILDQHNIQYSSNYLNSEDYDFWSQISRVSQLVNLPQKLLNYRVHANQITGNPKNAADRLKSVSAIRARHLKWWGVDFSEGELFLHNVLSDGLKAQSVQQIQETEQWLLKLLRSSKGKSELHQQYLQKIIFERWLRFCINFYGRKGINYFLRSTIYKTVKLSFARKKELYKNLFYSWRRKQIKGR